MFNTIFLYEYEVDDFDIAVENDDIVIIKKLTESGKKKLRMNKNILALKKFGKEIEIKFKKKFKKENEMWKFMDGSMEKNNIEYLFFLDSNMVKEFGKNSFASNNIKYLDLHTQSSCTNLDGFAQNKIESIRFPVWGNELKSIEENAFKENKIKKVDLRGCNELGKIGKEAFMSNEIESVILPLWENELKNIEENAFKENKIKKLDLGGCNKLDKIGKEAFMSNEIESVILPQAVSEISERAFSSNNIKYISGLQKDKYKIIIGKDAFEYNNILSLDLNLKDEYNNKVEYDNMYKMSEIKSILGVQKKIIKAIYTLDDFVISGNEIKSLTESGLKKLKENSGVLFLPANNKNEKITSLADECFKGKGIREINFANIETIGEAALANNYIISISGQENLKKIYNWAFYNNKMKNVCINKQTRYAAYSFDEYTNIFKRENF